MKLPADAIIAWRKLDEYLLRFRREDDNMKHDLFTRVALAEDLPDDRLRRGDVATVVEQHPGRPGQEPGYTLEVFNAVGETIDVVTVRESQVEPLTAAELLTVRPLATSARRAATQRTCDPRPSTLSGKPSL